MNRHATLNCFDLDLAVALADGWVLDPHRPAEECQIRRPVSETDFGALSGEYRYAIAGEHRGGLQYQPTTDWSIAGPIIEREMICLTRDAFPDPEHGHQPWHAESAEGLFTQYGDTALEAAMRCFVAMRRP